MESVSDNSQSDAVTIRGGGGGDESAEDQRLAAADVQEEEEFEEGKALAEAIPSLTQAKSGFFCVQQQKQEEAEGEEEVVVHRPPPAPPPPPASAAALPLQEAKVHPAPNPPPKTGVKSVCGRRKEMEDTVAVEHSFLIRRGPTDHYHFFGVYDGHGGAQAADHCRQELHVALAEEVARRAEIGGGGVGWEECMRNAFLKMDGEVASWKTSPASDTVGSTAIVAVLSGESIVVGNCGDSRAVLCRRGGHAVQLSDDHKPEREDEMARIEAAGGRVISWNGYRVFGVLAMSRAIGDRFMKPYVIAEPEVRVVERQEDDECLILASDGLWDVVSNQEACFIARRFLRDPQTAATALVRAAHDKGSCDNISVIVVDLRRRRPHHSTPPPVD